MANIELKQYPIGKFQRPQPIDDRILLRWVNSLEKLPENLQRLIDDIEEEDLELQYRPGSWSIRQIIHHLPDSHMNGYIRIKLALTEDKPTIKPYDENAWSELIDVEFTPVEVSIGLLTAIHKRWVNLIRNLNSAEMQRTFYHPENKIYVSVLEQIGIYAWHGEHHLAHIKLALNNRK